MNNLQKIIANLNPSCWLDSTAVNGIGVAQPALNADVSTWKDISGNGNDFVHEVIATYNPPKFNNATIFNSSLPSLQFVAANKNTLTTASETPTLWTDKATVVIVASNQLTNNTDIFAFANTGVTNGNLSFNGFTGVRTTLNTYDLNTSFEVSMFTSSVRYPYIAINKRSGESSVGLKNGLFTMQTVNSNLSYGRFDMTNGLITPQSNRKVALGARRLNTVDYDRFSSTNIHEVIIFPRILSDEETRQVQSYLKQKYNI